jgi:hypothetical protein
VISRRRLTSLPDLSSAERDALSDILNRVTTRDDNISRRRSRLDGISSGIRAMSEKHYRD